MKNPTDNDNVEKKNALYSLFCLMLFPTRR